MSSHLAGLSPKHRRFVDEYLVDLNGTQAAVRAGYKKKSARIQASKLLTNPNIAAAVKELRDQLAGKVELTAERTLQEISRIAFFNPKELFDADGVPLPIDQLSPGAAAAIAGLEVNEIYAGQGEDRKVVGVTKKYRLHNKNEALNMAGRYLKLFQDSMKIVGAVTLESLVQPIYDPKLVAQLAKAQAQAGQAGK
jgi:phage terminase small subunit